MSLIKLFDKITSDSYHKSKCQKLADICDKIAAVNSELCYNIQVKNGGSLTADQFKQLKNILSRPQKGQQLSEDSYFTREYLFVIFKNVYRVREA